MSDGEYTAPRELRSNAALDRLVETNQHNGLGLGETTTIRRTPMKSDMNHCFSSQFKLNTQATKEMDEIDDDVEPLSSNHLAALG